MASLHHFLDTNILVGSRIEWDGQHHHTHRYLQQDGFLRHTSERVYKECTGVFGLFRRTITKYLNYLIKSLPASPNPFTLDMTIKGLTRRYTLSIQNEKEKNVLTSFVHRNMDDLRTCVLGTEKDRETIRQAFIDAIKGALDSLDRDCRPDDSSAPVTCYTCCPDNYDVHLPDQKSALIPFIGYEPDILVILDAYFIQINRIGEEVSLVTSDKTHILNKRRIIEETLPGITIREPESFLIGKAG
ncbi:hypothetical protein J2T58_000086 [Methanocalculus alkaliphilus]|uniref:hypothetical protein n=1 Tax=Methanocalculus alkaliphilus TaxID=768730 RepID=UPI00209F4CD1|nr:hypothetical protein [Methanocalculus alkaliphilus]MCP1714259.1 hypothetical protein [Methanocalculus alkaliphilus]